MKYLLDVNSLVAWGWSDHTEHKRASAWIGSVKKRKDALLLTSAIPELGFVRVSVQRSGGKISVSEASKTLADMLAALGKAHAFLTDDLAATGSWPDWCAGSRHTTDAHLWKLAKKHGAQLATLDAGIPGAFQIPAS